MNSGKKSRFKTVTPVMIYLPTKLKIAFQAYAEKNKISGSKVAAEGIVMRISGEDDPFNKGFNEGLREAMKIVQGVEGAKMMFPSGKSFGNLVCEAIDKYIREQTEYDRVTANE